MDVKEDLLRANIERDKGDTFEAVEAVKSEGPSKLCSGLYHSKATHLRCTRAAIVPVELAKYLNCGVAW